MQIDVRYKKLYKGVNSPMYATSGSAAFDLCAQTAAFSFSEDQEIAVYGTGLAFEIPENHVMLLFPRSGLAFNNGIRLANCVGVIDSDFRGEVMVKLTKDAFQPDIHVKWPQVGDRVAQAIVLPYPKVNLQEVNKLSNTVRGIGGFGSTGK